jgi:heat shock protein HslJ
MSKRFTRSLVVPGLCVALMTVAACLPISAPEPAATTPSNAITNVVWHWARAFNRTTDETTEVPSPQNYTITFRDDGTVSGRAEFNNFTGTYSQEGGFFITLGATTMAACADASMDQQYLQLLGSTAAGGPDGAGGLALETAGGEQRMEFVNGGAAQE